MAAYGRVTLNRGGRNSRFDCNNIIIVCIICVSIGVKYD